MLSKNAWLVFLALALIVGLAWAGVAWNGSRESARTAPAPEDARVPRPEASTRSAHASNPGSEERMEGSSSLAGSQPKARVLGRVLDTAARGVVGAEVRLILRGRALEVVTEDGGLFVFDGIEAAELRRGQLELWVEHASHAPLARTHRFGNGLLQVDVGDLYLEPGGIVAGSIIDEVGQPVTGAVVHLEPTRGQALAKRPLRERWLPEVRADASGRFRIPAVNAGQYRLAARAPGCEQGSSEPFWVEDRGETLLEPLRLGRGYELVGTVRDPEGNPVAGAEVRLAPLREGAREERASSNTEGVFRIPHLPAGTVHVQARASGYASSPRAELDPGEHEQAALVLHLRRGSKLTGVVLDATGATPVARFGVRLRPTETGNGAPLQDFEWSERPAGRFTFEGLDAGSYVVDVVTPSHPLTSSAAVELDGENGLAHVTLRLEAGWIVRGRIVSKPSLAPLAGAVVELRREVAAGSTGSPGSPGSPGPHTQLTRTDGQGRFQLPPAAQGEYTVAARAPAHSDVRTAPFALASELSDVVLELPAKARLQGQVRGLPENLADEVHVLAQGGSTKSLHNARMRADHTYRIEGLEPGDYSVRAFVGPLRSVLASLSDLDATAGSTSPDVRLGPGEEQRFDPMVTTSRFARVHGTVTSNGKPGRGAWVELQAVEETRRSARDTDAEPLHGLAGFATFSNQVRADATGAYAFRSVPPGRYELRLRSGSGGLQELYRTQLDVPAEADILRDLVVETARLEVTIRTKGGERADFDAELHCYAGASARPQGTQPPTYVLGVRNGKIMDTEILGGAYYLLLRKAGRVYAEQSVYAAGMSEFELTLDPEAN